MRRISAGTFGRVYLVVALIVSAVASSSPPQIGLALAILAVQAFCIIKPPHANLNLALTITSLVIAPLSFEALIGGYYTALLVIPAVPLLDTGLSIYANTQVFRFQKIGRNASPVLKSLAAALASALLVAVIVWDTAWMASITVLLGYLALVLGYIYLRMPRVALQESKTWSRLIAGETDSAKVKINDNAGVAARVFLQSPDSWVTVQPAVFTLKGKGAVDANLRFTPMLAGPSKVHVQATAVDSRGLLVTGQILEPVDLHIIPRAKYALWLAEKFLTQNAAGTGSLLGQPQLRSRASSFSVEYHSSRPFFQGDRLKDIDWKHSYMLQELIVKQFAGAQGQTGIIVADLTAKDAEDADKLAYNLVMAALTLATETLPSALAVYNDAEVLAATKPMNSRETLKLAIELTQKITISEAKEKTLQPASLLRTKRTIGKLTQAESESAAKLKEVLAFELEANRDFASKHLGSQALMKVAQYTRAPAIITVVEPTSSNSEALLLTLEELGEKGYSTVTLR